MVKRDKITEIAIAIHDGSRVIDSYQTLVNPERSIPEFISRMTGITNEMVEGAPRFCEVAKDIVEFTEGSVFVAHNARFDYGFIREEFHRLGYTFSRKQLCTVRLSRQVFPEIGKYGLDNLIKHFKIKVNNRHRAMGDVEATVVVFEKILAIQSSAENIDELVNLGIRESKLPLAINLERLHALPESTGVYYFYDQFGDIIYVGKSINIKKRVMQHFAKITNKASKMQQRVHDISHEITGSELAALLLENNEIKKHQPDINRAMRRNAYPYALYAYKGENDYMHLAVHKKNRITHNDVELLKEFPKIHGAKSKLKQLIGEFALCLNKTELETGPGPCFNYQIKQCLGACTGEESPENYNIRVADAIDHVRQSLVGSALLVDSGREQGEKALIAIQNGHYYGFGYIDEGASLNTLHEAFDHVRQYPETPESMKIIENFVNSNKLERVIHF
jgi:DNA polymerase III subunit epsilon